jgi:hypothetical protein
MNFYGAVFTYCSCWFLHTVAARCSYWRPLGTRPPPSVSSRCTRRVCQLILTTYVWKMRTLKPNDAFEHQEAALGIQLAGFKVLFLHSQHTDLLMQSSALQHHISCAQSPLRPPLANGYAIMNCRLISTDYCWRACFACLLAYACACMLHIYTLALAALATGTSFLEPSCPLLFRQHMIQDGPFAMLCMT